MYLRPRAYCVPLSRWFLQSFDPRDGSSEWVQPLFAKNPLPATQFRALANEAAAAFQYGKSLTIVHPQDGSQLWTYNSRALNMNLLTMSASHLYIGETNRPPSPPAGVDEAQRLESHRAHQPLITTKSFAVTTGLEAWQTSDIPTSNAPWDGGTSIYEDGDTTYVCGNGLYAIETESGSLLWSLTVPTKHRLAQIVKWQDLVIWISHAFVIAVDSLTRQILWQEDLQTSSPTGMQFDRFDRIIVRNDVLYLGRSRFNPDRFWIETRDPLTGNTLATFPNEDTTLDPQLAWRFQAANTVCLIPTSTLVYAFDLATKTEVWHKNLGSEPTTLLTLCKQDW